ncbi:FAD-dependent oxidoreductase [Aromatoleum evansii]|uniref:FAD-dependent oxidoreductase n=1 Tax=Aromatoleum evansii TaxID=59406 RepID=A0ABZ1AEA3_AROEV|nr:FAD-dependent oxidoreductase [Aromatoleum evansii]
MKTPVLVVGGGLAGLTAARHLHRAGIGFQLLEARDRLGGRILSTDAAGLASDDGFDLGPSWFWPGMQSAMSYLVADLGLSAFPQNSEGDMLFQRMHGEAPRRFQGMRQEPESMRLIGGTGAIVAALAEGLPKTEIRLGARVTHVTLNEPEVEVRLVDAKGTTQTMRAMHVLFALPPRLLEATVAFSPALDAVTARNWRDTPTWMAPHAKFFALYDRPFWREAGLSGTAQSTVGPLVEIHDATTASGKAALFGFVGVSAQQRAKLGRDVIVQASIRQLAQLFGPEAGTPRATLFKDWAVDPLTATDDDRRTDRHPISVGLASVPGEWQNRILLAGSEAGRRDAGYLAGAIEAAEYAVMQIMNELEAAS